MYFPRGPTFSRGPTHFRYHTTGLSLGGPTHPLTGAGGAHGFPLGAQVTPRLNSRIFPAGPTRFRHAFRGPTSISSGLTRDFRSSSRFRTRFRGPRVLPGAHRVLGPVGFATGFSGVYRWGRFAGPGPQHFKLLGGPRARAMTPSPRRPN